MLGACKYNIAKQRRFRSDASEVSDVNSDLRSTTMAVCLPFSRAPTTAVTDAALRAAAHHPLEVSPGCPGHGAFK